MVNTMGPSLLSFQAQTQRETRHRNMKRILILFVKAFLWWPLLLCAAFAWVAMACILLLASLRMSPAHRANVQSVAIGSMLQPLAEKLFRRGTPAPSPAPSTTPDPDPAPVRGRHRRGVTPTPATARRRAAGHGGAHQRPSTTPPPAPAPRTGANPWPPTGQLVSTQEIITLLGQTTN